MDEDQDPRSGWLLGEPARVLLINAPLVLFVVSAEYTSWLFQERPRQPDSAKGLIQVMDHKGTKVYVTPDEAWVSQWLSNLHWIVLAIGVGLFCLRAYLKPGTPVIRLPEEGVPHPAEFVATLVVMASIAFGILTRKF